jgi:membrane protease YdiL (CAAX protease family)
MFTSYWRNYPWALQVALFMLMVFTMTSFGLVVVYWAVPHITGVSIDKIAGLHEGSARQVIDTALLGQFISTVFTFMVSAGLFAYVSHPRPAQYLGLRKPGKWVQLLIVVIMMAGFTPLILGLEGIMRLVDLGPAIKASQKEKDDIFNAFLSMPSIKYLITGIIIMGITPAISEELVFRGVIMRFAQRRSANIKTSIFASALLFAIIHFDAYGFFPIFLSGVLLGTVYYLSGSLWCSMFAHALHNSLQVALMYIARNNVHIRAIIDGNAVPLFILAPAVILFAGGFYLLWKNKTPLPENWANDFNDPKPIQLNTFSEN